MKSYKKITALDHSATIMKQAQAKKSFLDKKKFL